MTSAATSPKRRWSRVRTATAAVAWALTMVPLAAGVGSAGGRSPCFDSPDWDRARCRLAGRGIVPFAQYTAGVWANLAGGIETGARYEGFAAWGFDFELDRLAGLGGTTFRIDWLSYHGGEPSQDLIGPFDPNTASAWEGKRSVRFFRLYLEQRFLDDAVRVKVGQLTTDDDFLASPLIAPFANGAFGDLGGQWANPSIPQYPLAAPGVFVEAMPTDRWFARAGAYTGDVGTDESDNFGFDWSFNGDGGASLLAAVGRTWSPNGLAGSATLGIVANSGEHTDFASGGRVDGVYAPYATVEQALGSRRDGLARLAVFGHLRWPPQSDRRRTDVTARGGLVLFAPLPPRPDDVAAVAVSYSEFASAYVKSERAAGTDVTGRETLVEITYHAAITAWLTLQPDVQIFLDPHLSRDDSVVLGLRAILTM